MAPSTQQHARLCARVWESQADLCVCFRCRPRWRGSLGSCRAVKGTWLVGTGRAKALGSLEATSPFFLKLEEL